MAQASAVSNAGRYKSMLKDRVTQMYLKVLAGVYCVALATLFPVLHTRAQVDVVQPNAARGQNFSVRVKSVIARSAPGDKVIYEITYEYSFKGRNTVYIRGLGIVPPKRDNVNYLTFNQRLEFLESAEGPVLVTVPLQETTDTQGGQSADLPRETDFSPAFRSEVWSVPAVFHDRAARIIQKHFPFGYEVRQNNGVNYYTTTYRKLAVPHKNLRSQISVRVSHPYDATERKFIYRIHFVARDQPRMSNEWRYGDDRNELTKGAATAFIEALIEEFRDAGGRQQ